MRRRLLTLSTQSDTNKAINYLNQQQALVYYCDDGIAEIDNNIAENALHSVCLGRKNFLFLGADSGGERAAAMYAPIDTARLNGIDPEAYLRYVFTHIADYPSTVSQTSCDGASPTVSNKTQYKSHGRIGLEKSMTVLTRCLPSTAQLRQEQPSWVCDFVVIARDLVATEQVDASLFSDPLNASPMLTAVFLLEIAFQLMFIHHPFGTLGS